MQYMLMICHDETFRPPEAVEPEVVAWVEEMKRRRVRKSGDRFRPVSDAKTVRVRDGEVLLADGPTAQTKEQIAGYELIEMRKSGRGYRVRLQAPNGQARYGRGEAGLEKLIATRPLLRALLPEPEVVGLVAADPSAGIAWRRAYHDGGRSYSTTRTVHSGTRISGRGRVDASGEGAVVAPVRPRDAPGGHRGSAHGGANAAATDWGRIASSFDFTWISQKPAISSFVSRIAVRFPPENLTRAPLELAWSPSAESKTSAFTISSL